MRLRGIEINIELAKDGSGFVPSYHDPLCHKSEAMCVVPDCKRTTQDQAMEAITIYLAKRDEDAADKAIQYGRQSQSKKH